MNTVIVCALLLLAPASCSARSPIEQGLVGRWERVEHQSDHSQSVIGITFTKDGRYLWAFQGKPPVLTGRWRLKGQELITTIEAQAKDSGLPLLPSRIRYQIVRITEHELVINDGTAEGRWIRVREQ